MIYYFYRPYDRHLYDKYKDIVEQKLNIDNAFESSKALIGDLIIETNYEFVISYCFSIVNDWIEKNEFFSPKFISKLKTLLKKLNLEKELNSHENQYIINIEGLAFAKKRNLKQLIVDFPLENDKEAVFFKYDMIGLSRRDSSKRNKDFSQTQFYEGEMLISNIRIIASREIDFFSIYWSQIKSYRFHKYGIEFNLKNGVDIIINTENNEVTYVSLERMEKVFKIDVNA